MTIPTPSALAARPVSCPTVVDTRCGAEHTNNITIYRCTRPGDHAGPHIDAVHNAVWE